MVKHHNLTCHQPVLTIKQSRGIRVFLSLSVAVKGDIEVQSILYSNKHYKFIKPAVWPNEQHTKELCVDTRLSQMNRCVFSH